MITLHLANPLMRGSDVTIVQKLLVKEGFLKRSDIDGVFGPKTAEACVAAKKRYGLRDRRPVCGDRLLGLLKNPPKPKPTPSPTPSREDRIRGLIVEYCKWGILNEPRIHYGQVRPMDHMDDLKYLPINNDCSEFATKAYKYAGAPDPNGFGYNGLGYTGTIMHHCKQITLAQVKPGDLAVYGAYPGHHVAIVMEAGSDPVLCSHGQEKGPIKIRHSLEQKYQPPVAWYTIF